jgi:hypothetical protein
VKRYGKYRRNVSWIVKMIGKICKKSKLNSEKIWKIQKKIVKWYGKYGWNVKYGKYGRKVSWIDKRFGKYRKKLWNDMENMDEMWNDMDNMEER